MGPSLGSASTRPGIPARRTAAPPPWFIRPTQAAGDTSQAPSNTRQCRAPPPGFRGYAADRAEQRRRVQMTRRAEPPALRAFSLTFSVTQRDGARRACPTTGYYDARALCAADG